MDSLFSLPIVVQTLLATGLTCAVTVLGALLVFGFHRGRTMLLDAMLAAGAGVMLASSFFSLLQPGLAMAEALGQRAWLVILLGFLSGGAVLLVGEWLFARLACLERERSDVRRSRLLITSITLHNIPEGLAVGVAFGAAASSMDAGLLRAAWMLAVGIALQNFPEGAAVSLPLRRDGMSHGRACWYGFLSAVVEPMAGLVGVLLASAAQALLPFLLAFAAGAMILVVVAELVPESQRSASAQLMTVATMLGFALMMVLDVALG